jgi:hypothetical protein
VGSGRVRPLIVAIIAALLVVVAGCTGVASYHAAPARGSAYVYDQRAKDVFGRAPEPRLAYVEGRLQSRTWKAADGSKRRTVEVVAEQFKAIAPRASTPAAA